MLIGERIQAIRTHLGMSQVDFASLINVSKQTLYKYENDIITNIPSDKIEKMAEVTKTSPAYIMGWESDICCPMCHARYNPLTKYDLDAHDKFHQKYIQAEKKFGTLISRADADQKRTDSIMEFRNPSLSIEERVSGYEEYLKYDFIRSLWDNGLSLEHDDFETFCKKDIGLVSTKEALDELNPELYERLVEKYGKIEDTEYHKVIPLNKRDNRDIKNDLDSIMEKLANQEYGPAAFDGEDLPENEQELFAEQLELMLKRLKMINKEKYNPNKNKK